MRPSQKASSNTAVITHQALMRAFRFSIVALACPCKRHFKAAAIALAIGSVVVNYVNTQRDIDELRRGVASIREEVKADRVEHSRQMDVIVTRLTGIEKAVSGLEGKIDSLFRERR